MMLTGDLRQAKTHRLQKIVVCAKDRAIRRKLDHGLRSADGRDLRRIVDIQESRFCVRPLDNKPFWPSAGLQRIDNQIEGLAADPDRSRMGLFHPGQHCALMSRVLVENIDFASNKVCDAEARKFALQLRFGFSKQGHQSWIDIGDRQTCVGHHDIGRQGLKRECCRTHIAMTILLPEHRISQPLSQSQSYLSHL
ncbi:hypothetical protein [Fulvimarina manganoxydans]|uniref:hypothetical protein n=1 Tax=Fulvimarina manganoxydans TaxID=937218 RepID=UPI002354BECE|nr:hypothetical protein [Fulvimarina manganoxydans]